MKKAAQGVQDCRTTRVAHRPPNQVRTMDLNLAVVGMDLDLCRRWWWGRHQQSALDECRRGCGRGRFRFAHASVDHSQVWRDVRLALPVSTAFNSPSVVCPTLRGQVPRWWHALYPPWLAWLAALGSDCRGLLHA